jgi:plastocyanin
MTRTLARLPLLALAALGLTLGAVTLGAVHQPAPVLAQPAAVGMVDNLFVPDAITVAVGTTVTWANNDPNGEDHNVVAESGAFSSPVLRSGQTFSFTFSAPGRYAYFCEFHENQFGVVVVQ